MSHLRLYRNNYCSNLWGLRNRLRCPTFYMGSVIEGVQLNGVSIETVNKVVNIPVASEETYGVVKSNGADNGVVINEDGTMEVVSVSFDKLIQSEGDEFILDGGGAGV